MSLAQETRFQEDGVENEEGEEEKGDQKRK
jgi:hypothetical protein